jgi:Mn2+/Fe2+ NRAMP family transporter
MVLFFYVGVVFTVDIPWQQVLVGTFLPRISLNSDYLPLVIAVFGTTISPYLFFWLASQEIEEMHRYRPRRPLKELPRGGDPELKRMAIDTAVGMIYSNIVAYFIVLTTAATLYAHGITEIRTAADAAEALRPIAGEFTFLLFALGIIGTGLLAIRCSQALQRMVSPKPSDGVPHWQPSFRKPLASTRSSWPRRSLASPPASLRLIPFSCSSGPPS